MAKEIIEFERLELQEPPRVGQGYEEFSCLQLVPHVDAEVFNVKLVGTKFLQLRREVRATQAKDLFQTASVKAQIETLSQHGGSAGSRA